jgi:hypothetical protein
MSSFLIPCNSLYAVKAMFDTFEIGVYRWGNCDLAFLLLEQQSLCRSLKIFTCLGYVIYCNNKKSPLFSLDLNFFL